MEERQSDVVSTPDPARRRRGSPAPRRRRPRSVDAVLVGPLFFAQLTGSHPDRRRLRRPHRRPLPRHLPPHLTPRFVVPGTNAGWSVIDRVTPSTVRSGGAGDRGDRVGGVPGAESVVNMRSTAVHNSARSRSAWGGSQRVGDDDPFDHVGQHRRERASGDAHRHDGACVGTPADRSIEPDDARWASIARRDQTSAARLPSECSGSGRKVDRGGRFHT